MLQGVLGLLDVLLGLRLGRERLLEQLPDRLGVLGRRLRRLLEIRQDDLDGAFDEFQEGNRLLRSIRSGLAKSFEQTYVARMLSSRLRT